MQISLQGCVAIIRDLRATTYAAHAGYQLIQAASSSAAASSVLAPLAGDQ